MKKLRLYVWGYSDADGCGGFAVALAESITQAKKMITKKMAAEEYYDDVLLDIQPRSYQVDKPKVFAILDGG